MSGAIQSQELAALVARRLAERHGELAVLGLGRSGVAATRLLRAAGLAVYVSDSSKSDAVQQAATRLEGEGASVQVGGHDIERLSRASVLIASPGIPPDVPALARPRAAGVPIVSEVEV